MSACICIVLMMFTPNMLCSCYGQDATPDCLKPELSWLSRTASRTLAMLSACHLLHALSIEPGFPSDKGGFLKLRVRFWGVPRRRIRV